jgi:hypothetical protein
VEKQKRQIRNSFPINVGKRRKGIRKEEEENLSSPCVLSTCFSHFVAGPPGGQNIVLLFSITT